MKLNWNNGPLADGLRCFERQEFFAAHEFWESVWLNCEQPQKTFLQALIQVASAFHHHQRDNSRGTLSLLERAHRKLEALPEFFEQIDVVNLRTSVATWMRALQSTTPKAFPSYPTIRVIDSQHNRNKAD